MQISNIPQRFMKNKSNANRAENWSGTIIKTLRQDVPDLTRIKYTTDKLPSAPSFEINIWVRRINPHARDADKGL